MGANKKQAKSAARLYAVQALFQMEASDQTMDEVRDQFVNIRFGEVIDGNEMAEGDVDLFEALIIHAVRKQSQIDKMTDRALVAKWPIDKIDPTLRALFRAAGGEMLGMETPSKVIITEYVDIARSFFDEGGEVKFTNAVLDHMAKEAREDL